MKRLVVCCDGTWNTPDAVVDGIPCPTNVVKVAEAVAPHDDSGTLQCVYYDRGVGTRGGRVRKAFDGATGTGLTANVLKAYRWISGRYEAGDEIYLIGFSRGAFTARSLGGLIRNSGILRRGGLDQEGNAYALYRSRSKADHPRARESRLFRLTYSVEDRSPIKCIAVWDTVGALGNPLLIDRIVDRRNEFHDTQLSGIVENAFQAVAIDEKRRLFEPALWFHDEDQEGQVLEQRWFVGVHSNIGGGYREGGLADRPLRWLIEKMAELGLKFGGMEFNPSAVDRLEESWNGAYRLIPPYDRPIRHPSNLPGRDPGDKPVRTNETLDPSVLELWDRWRNYRPPNLTDFFRRFPREAP
jgi:uncharacterized protein (DUF2235 family)